MIGQDVDKRLVFFLNGRRDPAWLSLTGSAGYTSFYLDVYSAIAVDCARDRGTNVSAHLICFC